MVELFFAYMKTRRFTAARIVAIKHMSPRVTERKTDFILANILLRAGRFSSMKIASRSPPPNR